MGYLNFISLFLFHIELRSCFVSKYQAREMFQYNIVVFTTTKIQYSS